MVVGFRVQKGNVNMSERSSECWWCGSSDLVRVDEFDAIACRTCGRWNEPRCGAQGCVYCTDRPDQPSVEQLNDPRNTQHFPRVRRYRSSDVRDAVAVVAQRVVASDEVTHDPNIRILEHLGRHDPRYGDVVGIVENVHARVDGITRWGKDIVVSPLTYAQLRFDSWIESIER